MLGHLRGQCGTKFVSGGEKIKMTWNQAKLSIKHIQFEKIGHV